jgi:Alw26I/Eco31I/Esp3I family type II restriction m6 adenine DNA methyltransferase
MRHVATAVSKSTRADIEDRLTGRFYTPLPVAEALACASAYVGCPESVCDPFCGDGRLVIVWLRHQISVGSLARLKRIALWDYDADAVRYAAGAVREELTRLGLKDSIVEASVGDTFSRRPGDRFELILTNPPWEQLKPDTRDGLASDQGYRGELRSFAERLAAQLPEAAASKRRTIGGYTVNLARAGALLAAQMTSPNGTLSIVLPSTIFGDQVSEAFRSRFFSEISVDQITHYPAEARLFPGVDQSFVTITGRGKQTTSTYRIRQVRSDLTLAEERIHSPANNAAPLPLNTGGAQHALVNEMRSKHPDLRWLEADLRFGLRLGRELDETRISESFDPHNGVPFVKGRNIGRFSFERADLPLIDVNKRKLPGSFNHLRLAWRDVSRPSQKRRIHACLIPAGYVTGNSLGIARFATGDDINLRILLALMNSVVFEIQVRDQLLTNHVSQGVLRKCAIPYAAFENSLARSHLSKLVEVANTDIKSAAIMEVEIAKIYGISREKFETILLGFDKITAHEMEIMLSKELWS